jgi:hypothetical protein
MIPHAKIPLQQQLERGVYEMSFCTADGALILVAVDHRGFEVARANVVHLEHYADARARLEEQLAAAEAPSHLQLVADQPAVPRVRRFAFHRAGDAASVGARAPVT